MSRIFPRGLGGIIFDCDGVMIESRAANIHFYNRILECFGLPHMRPEQEDFAHMASSRQVLEHLLPQDCLDRLGPVVQREISYKRDILPRITLMPGFVDFALAMHRDYGLRLAISTNRTTEGVQDVLDYFSLPAIFSPVMTASNCRPKPLPDAALGICREWNETPERVLMVGDSQSDRDAARAAGVPFCAFANQALDGDVKALTFADLREQLPLS